MDNKNTLTKTTNSNGGMSLYSSKPEHLCGAAYFSTSSNDIYVSKEYGNISKGKSVVQSWSFKLTFKIL